MFGGVGHAEALVLAQVEGVRVDAVEVVVFVGEEVVRQLHALEILVFPHVAMGLGACLVEVAKYSLQKAEDVED